jgi:thymidylate kinase
MARITSRNHDIQLYESLNTLQKVHNSYQKAMEKVSGSESIFTLDGRDTIEHIRERIWQKVQELARS